MSERDMGRTNHILDMELDLGNNFIHLEPHVLFGNRIGYSAPGAHLSQVASGIPANIGFQQFLDHNGSNSPYGNQYNNTQLSHPVTNFDAGCFAPLNFSSNSYMASSSSRPIHNFVNSGASEQHQISGSQRIMGVTMEHGSNTGFVDNVRGLHKSKCEGISENFYHVHGLANPDSSAMNLSTSFGHHHQSESYEAGPSMSDASAFIPEHRGGMMTMTDGSQERVTSRVNTIDAQLESAFMHHCNHLFQEKYVPHFSPAGSWPDQFRNIINDGGVANHPYTHTAPLLPGYPGPTTSRNAAVMHHPPAIYNHHPVLPGQSMWTHSHTHYQVPPLAFGHPVNNFQVSNTSFSRDGLHLGPRVTRHVHSNASDGTVRPPRRLHATRDYSSGHMRFIHPEHVAFLDLSAVYEARNHSDQHRDMRLDIDSMSYEELLALEEHIGDVSVGLSEECILNHLKTRIHVPELACLSLKSSCCPAENETCVICQVEFEENERVGTLVCGHDYHADCIKQWLLLKNICPICKTTALEEDKRKDGER